ISSLFIFIHLPPTPTSTLFPYTTLFRSSTSRSPQRAPTRLEQSRCQHPNYRRERYSTRPSGSSHGNPVPARQDTTQSLSQQRMRSEEHTSELQSLAYLVCRLLLEKKKKK